MDVPKDILIFGCGNLGLEVAEQLRASGYAVRLAAADYSQVGYARAKDFDAVVVDVTDDEALRRLGLGDRVRVVFCLLEDEAQNLFLALSARALAPSVDILCVAESEGSEAKLKAAGASKVIDPYALSAMKIHELIRRPWILDTLESTLFGRESLDLAEVPVVEGSGLMGRELQELHLRESYNLILLGVVTREPDSEGDSMIYVNAGRSHRLETGDLLVIIGLRDEIERFRGEIQASAWGRPS